MPEETECYLCSHRPGERLFSSRDTAHNIEGVYGWNLCPICGLVYLSPRPTPDEMPRYYPMDYALFLSTTRKRRWWQPSLWMERRDLNQRCKAAVRLRSRGRILDVGCGTGEFLAAMQQRKWETVGIEPSDVAAAYARECLKLDVWTGVLQSVDLPPSSFDVITLWTVLEHLYDPLSVLRKTRRLLKRNGLLIISIPDIESIDARLFGRFWVGYDTPRHLYVYSCDVIRELLTRAGFELGDVEHFQADYYTFLGSLDPWLRANFKHTGLLPLLSRILKFPGARMLTWPLFWGVNMLGKGCIITIYARPIS